MLLFHLKDSFQILQLIQIIQLNMLSIFAKSLIQFCSLYVLFVFSHELLSSSIWIKKVLNQNFQISKKYCKQINFSIVREQIFYFFLLSILFHIKDLFQSVQLFRILYKVLLYRFLWTTFSTSPFSLKLLFSFFFPSVWKWTLIKCWNRDKV